MRLLCMGLCLTSLVGLSACAGSVMWAGELDEQGRPVHVEVDLPAGATQTVAMSLLAEGRYAGAYDFSATPRHSSVATATVAPSSGEVEDGVPFEVVVTIRISETAAPGDDGSVSVEARARDDETLFAMTTIFVDVVE